MLELEAGISGLFTGAGYALIAVTITLMYRSTGVLSFAHAAFAALSAYLYIDLVDAGQGGDAPGEFGDVAPQQRLAAGEADAAHAQPRKRADQSLDLVEAEPVRGFFESLKTLRHAIAATQIATIGDRQPHVFDVAAVLIDEGLGHGG